MLRTHVYLLYVFILVLLVLDEEDDGTDGTTTYLDEDDFCVCWLLYCAGSSLSSLCISTFIMVPFNSFNKAYPTG